MSLVVVDFEGTSHAQLMERCARAADPEVHIQWMSPDHSLPSRLRALPPVHAVAIPLVFRGANVRDRFTRELMEAIRELRQRGVEVFVSAPPRWATPLREVAVPVSAPPVLADALASGGASGACVRAATLHAANCASTPAEREVSWQTQST